MHTHEEREAAREPRGRPRARFVMDVGRAGRLLNREEHRGLGAADHGQLRSAFIAVDRRRGGPTNVLLEALSRA